MWPSPRDHNVLRELRGKVIDKGTDSRWQSATCREDEMDYALLAAPFGQDLN